MNAFALFAKRPLWATVSSDQQLNWVTYQEVFVRVCAVGRGLQARLKRSDFVAIGGENTPEWLICDYACQIFGFVSVPIHTHLTTDRIQFILEQCKVSLILCSTAIAERLGPDCQLPMYFLDALPPNPRALGVLEAEGRERPLTIDPRVGDELVTVVWTSGSTGDAKGVMISERLYHSEISAPWLLPFDLRRVFFSPLAHTPDRKNARKLSSFFSNSVVLSLRVLADGTQATICLTNGGQSCLYAGPKEALFDVIALVKPTAFAAPPRLWNELYNQYQQRLALRLNGRPETSRDRDAVYAFPCCDHSLRYL